jgi:hypothetical protein
MRTSDHHGAIPELKNEFGRAGLSEHLSTNRGVRPHRSLVFLIWLYFWLLILEGALRKWIFPSLSAPLLIVRDPVVILIYAIALAQGVFPFNRFVLTTFALAGLSFAASFSLLDHLGILLYGLRTDFLHLPLIFLMPRVLGQEEVNRFGRWFLLLALPMTFLVLWQFASPQGSWINAAVGGELGGQLISVGGRIRPAGLFSFVTGMVSFLSVIAAFLLGAYLDRNKISNWLRTLAIPCLLLSLVLSGSRSALAGVTIILIAVLLICARQFSRVRSILTPAILGYLIFVALCYLPLFREGLEVHEERLRAGGGVKNGIVVRYLGDLGESIDTAIETPLLGRGLGIGTNAGAALLTGSRSFLLGESEWSRVVAESGAILGYAFILLRVAICWYLIRESWSALNRGQATPLLLVAASGLDLVSGQFGQPATLGFVVFTSGLALAAINRPGVVAPVPAQNQEIRRIRGRSPIAESIINSPDVGEAPISGPVVQDVDLPQARPQRD